MDYFCDVGDKTIKFISQRKHLKVQHTKKYKMYTSERYYRKSWFIWVSEIFNDFITNHNKKLIYLVTDDFKLVFVIASEKQLNNKGFYPYNKSDSQNYLTILSSKRLLLLWIKCLQKHDKDFFIITKCVWQLLALIKSCLLIFFLKAKENGWIEIKYDTWWLDENPHPEMY